MAAAGQVHAQISDHAVLRYLERAYRMNIPAVREEMAASLQPAIDFGAPVVLIHGVRLVLRDGLYCVTALPRRRSNGIGRA
jgi:hypothetical protein